MNKTSKSKSQFHGNFDYVTGICENDCSHTFCQGGNPNHGGVQLNINKTCENYCVWTRNSSEKYIPGDCVLSIPAGKVFKMANCHPCKRIRKETLESWIGNPNIKPELALESGM